MIKSTHKRCRQLAVVKAIKHPVIINPPDYNSNACPPKRKKDLLPAQTSQGRGQFLSRKGESSTLLQKCLQKEIPTSCHCLGPLKGVAHMKRPPLKTSGGKLTCTKGDSLSSTPELVLEMNQQPVQLLEQHSG